MVIDIDYMQEVDLSFCHCRDPRVVGDTFQQLIRRHLFPATILEPHTAFTFRALTLFHTLTLHGKVTNYDFYRAIQAST